jgi:hypothetical protein
MKNKLITFAIILLFVTACNKQQITNTVTRQGKLYGYGFSSYVANGKVNFGMVNHRNASTTNTASLLTHSLYANQGMYIPQGVYHIPTPTSLINGTDTGQVFRINTITNAVDSFNTQLVIPVVGLMYSPTTTKTYGIQRNIIFDYTVDETTTPKRMIKGTQYTGLSLGVNVTNVSSTAHGYLPFLYASKGDTIRKLDVSTGIYTTINSMDTSNYGAYAGIRYNMHDSMVYVLRVNQFKVKLWQINPVTNAFTEVVLIPDIEVIDFAAYTATIHCCENMYILFMNKKFYNIDITKKTVEVVNSDNLYQGLIWAND